MTATTVEAGDELPLTVPALLVERSADHGGKPLLVCDDQVLTYADAESRSALLAKGLLAAGVGKGTHVGLLHPNGPEFVVGWLAAARIGAVSLPLSTFSTSTELHGLLRQSDVGILLAANAYRNRDYVQDLVDAVPGLDLGQAPPLVVSSTPALRRVVFHDAAHGVDPGWTESALVDAGAVIGDDVLAAAAAAVHPSDRMVIVHTSGSTNAPKGVIHQHGSLIRHLDNLNQLRRYTADEVLFSNSPFFWIGGFAYGLLGTLLAGATLVCSNSTDVPATLDLLERTQPTMVNGFAASVAHLAKDPSFADRDLSSIRRGNLWPIMPADVRAADPELRHNMLGMTEAGSVCLASPDEGDQPEHRRGSFGQPAPGFEAKIVDPDTGEDCAIGQVGELWFRGPFLMEGYYGRTRSETFTPDEWFRTGDLFHLDDEGFFYFTARHGDMIKTAGANVSPREVEAAITEVTGLVAHVVGLDDPDRGQVVAAAVRLPHGQDAPDVDELRTALRSELSAYKVPTRFLFLSDEDVPMMSSGKLDARALKGRFGVSLEPLCLPDVLRRNTERHGAKAAVVTHDRAITYAELDDQSRALASRLVAAGVGPSSRVGFLAPNGIDWMITSVAVMRIGAVLVPLSTLLRPPELRVLLQVADVSHLVLTRTFRGRDYLEDLEVAAPGLIDLTSVGRRHPDLPFLQHVWVDDEIPTAAVDGSIVEAMEALIRPADDLAILFTSGSRGTPKGTIHTHDSALHGVAAGLEARCLHEDDRLYIPMPFFWSGGFCMGLLANLVAGSTLVTEAAPEPARTLALIQREQVTLFRGWPDQAAGLVADPTFSSTDLSRLRPGSLAVLLPPDERPRPGSRALVFGMSETAGVYVGSRIDVDLPEDKWGSCGRLLDGIEGRVVDPESGRPVEPGATGTILLRGRNVMRGICGRTREDTFDVDGFYDTGDLGRLDVDGYLWFEGRADDMFKVKGATVYPAEVEAAVRAVDGVRQAHVTDVVNDDGAPAVGVFVISARPIDELVREVRTSLSAFKVPTCWVVSTSVDRVPMTGTGKVDKAALQDLLRREGTRTDVVRTNRGGTTG